MAQAGWSDVPLNLPLVTDIGSRDSTATKDGRMINCYAELDPSDGQYWIEKRPGLSAPVYTPNAAGNGMYLWETSAFTGDLYFVAGGNLYKNGSVLSAITLPTKNFFWQQVRGTTPYLVLGDGSNAYYTDGTTVTNIHGHDANFPATFVPGWAYLDGTLYVMTADGTIQGSNIDDPTTWNALNKIVARIETDFAVCLIKHLTYVVALKRWTTEAFYDAGNATGSPLGSVQGAFSPYGCVGANTVQEIDGTHFWLTSNKTLSPQVVRMDNLQITVISTPAVERLLDGSAINSNSFRSFTFKHAGHRWYVLAAFVANFSLAYDIDQKRWYIWTDYTGTAAFPIGAVSYDFQNRHLAQDFNNGAVYIIDSDFVYPTDNGNYIPVDIYTANFDAGVDRVKTLPIMRIYGDQVSGSTVKVRVNDNDFDPTGWSSFRDINLGTQRPILTDCGAFYRRAWHFHHKLPTSFRIKAAQLQMDKGTL